MKLIEITNVSKQVLHFINKKKAKKEIPLFLHFMLLNKIYLFFHSILIGQFIKFSFLIGVIKRLKEKTLYFVCVK